MTARISTLWRAIAKPAWARIVSAWALGAPLRAQVGAQTAPLVDIREVGVGRAHACALRLDGSVSCWGDGRNGQLGHGQSAPVRELPVEVIGLPRASGLAVAHEHSCALAGSGALYCWGSNRRGELGIGRAVTSILVPQRVTPLPSALAVATGGNAWEGGFTCALSAERRVHCWGANQLGQLGNGGVINSSQAVEVPGLGDVVDVAAGGAHACALNSMGGVLCWGANTHGQLGDGSTVNRSGAVAVPGLGSGVLAIAAGDLHSCALRSNGEMQCWGDGFFGQIGDGRCERRLLPTTVVGAVPGVVGIAAGGTRSCALTSSGALHCWGGNSWGELGNGEVLPRSRPAVVEGVSVTQVGLGAGATCARTTGGAAKCSGDHSQGTLGDGTRPFRTLPSALAMSQGVSISASIDGVHTCAIDASGSLRCWGENSYGQLGLGGTQPRNQPALVGSGFTEVGTGQQHSCAIDDQGSVWCWGGNSYGQLGDGSFNQRLQPVAVSGLGVDMHGLSVGSGHACAITLNRQLACWGLNTFGQLGDGTTYDRNSYVLVSGLTDIVEVATGLEHTCARAADRSVYCWGRQDQGQLGNGSNGPNPSLVPRAVMGLPDGALAITAGQNSSCAIDAAGGVKCWGNAFQGVLGNGEGTGIHHAPVQVSGLESGVAAIDAVGSCGWSVGKRQTDSSRGAGGVAWMQMRLTEARPGNSG